MTTPVEMQGPPAQSPSGLVRALAVATALVFLFGMVGLGTIKAPAPRSHDVLATVFGAADKTASASSFKMATTAETSVSGSSLKVPGISVEGAISVPDKRANMTMHIA